MAAYKRKTGEKRGHHWWQPNVKGTTEYPHVRMDVNYWKAFVHARLKTEPGDAGALAIYGQPVNHRLLVDHITKSQFATRTEGHGRVVWQWKQYPARPDDHWFDNLVGAAAAASNAGLAAPDQPGRRKGRRRKPGVSYS